MRKKLFIGLLLTVSLLIAVVATATPIGKVEVDVSTPSAFQGAKVYYAVWTFAENGSPIVIKRGVLSDHLFFKDSIYLSKSELQRIENTAKKIGSKTAFIGIDVWMEKDGKVYSLVDGFDRSLSGWELEKSIKFKLNLKEASVVSIPSPHIIRTSSKEITPMSPTKHWYEWRTADERYFTNIKIPLLIIHKKSKTKISATVQLGAKHGSYLGPDIIIAFGDQISKKVSFDPSSIKLKVLGRSFTDWYRGGSIINMEPSNTWGYIWVKGTIHYIHQKEYFCYKSAYHPNPTCLFTGNERYFAKIDRFEISSQHGSVKDIESGVSFEKPQFYPEDVPIEYVTLNAPRGKDVYLADFFDKIYTETKGYSFGIGAPVGALINYLTGERLPPWFNLLLVGFSVEGYSTYAVMGEIRNDGPINNVKFSAAKSAYPVSIPINKPWWEFWKSDHVNTNVPVGFYVEVFS
ncbi:MAG: hypothetical protein J7L37_00565 [Thermococcus sp.]|nr:hypothetical protein [Thermococcus sp.]